MDRRRAEVLRVLGIDRYVPRSDAAGQGTRDAESDAAAAPRALPASSAPAQGGARPRAAETLSPLIPASPPQDPPAALSPDVDVATLDWEALERTVAACTRCGLEATRTQTVFGVGDRSPDWLVVGEAPGQEEDRRGEPFVGRAGQLLDSMLRALQLARGQKVYIANTLKCRPPGNRDPQPREVACCMPYLQRQIALLRPKVILCVGRIAAQNLLATDAPLGKLRGRVHRLEPSGTPVVVTYHPAYLLRSPGEKRKAWADLQYAREVASGHGA